MRATRHCDSGFLRRCSRAASTSALHDRRLAGGRCHLFLIGCSYDATHLSYHRDLWGASFSWGAFSEQANLQHVHIFSFFASRPLKPWSCPRQVRMCRSEPDLDGHHDRYKWRLNTWLCLCTHGRASECFCDAVRVINYCNDL
jgi:hypothetical protein